MYIYSYVFYSIYIILRVIDKKILDFYSVYLFYIQALGSFKIVFEMFGYFITKCLMGLPKILSQKPIRLLHIHVLA
jgi:hypothetical protein